MFYYRAQKKGIWDEILKMLIKKTKNKRKNERTKKTYSNRYNVKFTLYLCSCCQYSWHKRRDICCETRVWAVSVYPKVLCRCWISWHFCCGCEGSTRPWRWYFGKNQTSSMGKAPLAMGGRTYPLLAQPFQTSQQRLWDFPLFCWGYG